jgi:hypothetical protein
MVFPMKYRGFLQIFPSSSKLIERKILQWILESHGRSPWAVVEAIVTLTASPL